MGNFTEAGYIVMKTISILAVFVNLYVVNMFKDKLSKKKESNLVAALLLSSFLIILFIANV